MAASPSQDKMYKVLMVGRAAVGKTCILRRYCLEYFSDQVVPTLGCDFVLVHPAEGVNPKSMVQGLMTALGCPSSGTEEAPRGGLVRVPFLCPPS